MPADAKVFIEQEITEKTERSATPAAAQLS
jgi:hypothetical protein